MRKNFKKIVCFACILSLCGIMGVKYFYNPQEPVVIETVSDSMAASGELAAKESAAANLNLNVKSAVLIDAETGKVLYQQDSHKELAPASVTKVMTMLLVLEAVEDGKVKLSDKVTISERAASMGGSQMYMETGEVHTLEELLAGIAIVSANDACVAVSEYIAGSEEVFVEKMNARARELGMRDTHFVNTNGLPVTDHYTSAYDIAVASRLLLSHKETQKWFNTWQTTVKVGLPGKEKEFALTNTNKLIKQYPGANGIKTGFTQEAGFCLSASAVREDTTLIAVVLGAETSKIRFEEVSRLLNYGFANYTSVSLAQEGQSMKKVHLDKGDPAFFCAVTKEKISAFVKKGKEKQVSCKVRIDKNPELPLKKGDKVGTVTVCIDKEESESYDLVCDRNVKKVSFLTYYMRKLSRLFGK